MPRTIVPYRAFARRDVRGTHVEAGQIVFAIQDDETGLYFVWSYSDEKYANKIANRVKPGDANDRAANWRAALRNCVVSDRKKD